MRRSGMMSWSVMVNRSSMMSRLNMGSSVCGCSVVHWDIVMDRSGNMRRLDNGLIVVSWNNMHRRSMVCRSFVVHWCVVMDRCGMGRSSMNRNSFVHWLANVMHSFSMGRCNVNRCNMHWSDMSRCLVNNTVLNSLKMMGNSRFVGNVRCADLRSNMMASTVMRNIVVNRSMMVVMMCDRMLNGGNRADFRRFNDHRCKMLTMVCDQVSRCWLRNDVTVLV